MPIEVVEQRTGVYEIQDKYNYDDRKQFANFLQLTKIGIIVLTIVLVLVLLTPIEILLKQIFIFVFIPLIIASYLLDQRLKLKLPEEIAGLFLNFDENKKLYDLSVLFYQSHKSNDFLQKRVRFNQSIGFQAIIDDFGDIQIEIIVDPNFPGTAIFRTYDLYALAELIRLFEMVFPTLDKWYYKTDQGEDWDSSIKDELNNEIQVAKVPWNIREFFL